jgi:hypothetical protein
MTTPMGNLDAYATEIQLRIEQRKREINPLWSVVAQIECLIASIEAQEKQYEQAWIDAKRREHTARTDYDRGYYTGQRSAYQWVAHDPTRNLVQLQQIKEKLSAYLNGENK